MKLLLSFALIAVLFSCNSKPEEATSSSSPEKNITPKIALSGTNYFFGPKFNAQDCEPVAECDCCSWNILFIDATKFVTVCPCESEESVLRGTYKILDDKVVLTYDKLQIDREYNYEAEADTTGTAKSEYNIIVTKSHVLTEVLTPMYCKGKLYFTVEADKELSFGSIDNRYSLKERIQMLKDDGIWDKVK
jgi:hypothetical protein